MTKYNTGYLRIIGHAALAAGGVLLLAPFIPPRKQSGIFPSFFTISTDILKRGIPTLPHYQNGISSGLGYSSA